MFISQEISEGKGARNPAFIGVDESSCGKRAFQLKMHKRDMSDEDDGIDHQCIDPHFLSNER